MKPQVYSKKIKSNVSKKMETVSVATLTEEEVKILNKKGKQSGVVYELETKEEEKLRLKQVKK